MGPLVLMCPKKSYRATLVYTQEGKGEGRKDPHTELGPKVQRGVNEEATARACEPGRPRPPAGFPILIEPQPSSLGPQEQ